MKKSHLRVSLILLTALLLNGCGQSDTPDNGRPRQKRKVIKLAHSHQADVSSEIHLAAWIFQKWVNDHSDTLEVKIYASNALGQERDVYEAIQLGGGADCVISGTAILNNFYPPISALDLPFLWNDYDHVHRVLDGPVGRSLAEELIPKGFHVLAWMDSWGYRNIVTAKKDIRSLADIAGLKLRTIQTPIYMETLNALGANATPMSFGEVYTCLQTGVLDGFEHCASVVKANKFYEVADYIALTRHLFGPLVFVYSEVEWKKLTEPEKQVIQEAALLARDVQRSLAPIRDAESLAYLAEQGMTVHPIDMKDIRQTAPALQDKLAAEFGAVDLLKKIRNTE